MDPGADSDWRSLAFRQKVVGQIEEAMRKAGTAHNKSSNDMENHVFMKAKSREEYLSLVARLIIHFRDIHKKAQGQGDPMNALQNLTGGPPSGAAGMGMVRPQGVGMNGLGQISQQMLSGQTQPGASGMPPHGLQGVANAAQQRGFLPSPSPQPSQSPATARTPQNFSVPSPGPLNTPGNPGSVMSPASSSQTEEQQYLEKLKQLSKYIEPLRRMINKIDKNEGR
ncbi:UNVERIFIED_CONTAM: hypothetical protein FKN15_017181 [Acipenser sinensis]